MHLPFFCVCGKTAFLELLCAGVSDWNLSESLALGRQRRLGATRAEICHRQAMVGRVAASRGRLFERR
eukprot:7423643-Pyramimonas_sp.AAC.1